MLYLCRSTTCRVATGNTLASCTAIRQLLCAGAALALLTANFG
jgi:hypothetical protein